MNNRELDARVAEALGLEVVGEAWADQDPENPYWWHVYDRKWTGRSLQPVYVAHCVCDIHPLYADCPELVDIEPRQILGHYPGCLEVVAHHSTDIAAAWQVVEWMNKQGYWLVFKITPDSNHFVTFSDNQYTFDGYAKTAPEAICRAFLKAMGKE